MAQYEATLRAVGEALAGSGRDPLLALLADVVMADRINPRDGTVWVRLPVATVQEMRAEVDAGVTPCPACGMEHYAGTGCSECYEAPPADVAAEGPTVTPDEARKLAVRLLVAVDRVDRGDGE